MVRIHPTAVRRRLVAGACTLWVALAAWGVGAGGASAAATPPRLAVRAAALLDARTGQLLYADNAQDEVSIASTTKLMTALVTLEHASLSTVFVAPPLSFSAADSQIGLRAGERLTVHDLLLAMLLPSGDDAAQDLAFNVGHGSVARFIGLMNARAAALGLTHTHYSTPVGLDTPGNYSTATDLVRLTRYVLATQPFLRSVVARPSALLRTGARQRLVVNLNDLVGRVPWITGVKTGHTLQAGYVLVGSGKRHGMSLISVVLGTSSAAARDATTLSLLRYGFDAFRLLTPVRAGDGFVGPLVRGRAHLRSRVLATGGLTRTIARDQIVRTVPELPRQLTGPLPRGRRVGTLVVLAGPRVIARIPLVLAAAVPAPPPVSLAGLALPITLLCACLLALAGALAIRFGRTRRRGTAAVGRRRQ